MTENPDRIPENATNLETDERGISSWLCVVGTATVAFAQAKVVDEDGDACWLRQGVSAPPSSVIPNSALILEARTYIAGALDYIEEHGPAAYRKACEEHEQNSSSGESA